MYGRKKVDIVGPCSTFLGKRISGTDDGIKRGPEWN